MWADHVLPRFADRGLGGDTASRTYRLAGIGESQVADILGEALLRTANPEIATYARAEAVDVRISAIGDGTESADAMVERAAAVVVERLGSHVWATGTTTWSEAIGERLDAVGWTLAITEIAAGARLSALLGDVPWLIRAEARASDDGDLEAQAERIRSDAGGSVGLALRVRSRGGDSDVDVAIATPGGRALEHRVVFLDGANGRLRAALSAASILLETLRDP